jgi:hypothetical protein
MKAGSRDDHSVCVVREPQRLRNEADLPTLNHLRVEAGSTLYPQKLALTSPTSGGRSVGSSLAD